MRTDLQPRFFATPAKLRAWYERNHDRADELLLGLHKVGSGKPSVTYREALDEALSFGWIDGVRRSLGETSYTIRFTPRKAKSYWSAVNRKRAKELIALGRMLPAGREAFDRRHEDSDRYSNEVAPRTFDRQQEKAFRANRKAWAFWEEQPPGYRRTTVFWVTSAKREETRARRLAQLIEDSEQGRRVGLLTPPSRRAPKA